MKTDPRELELYAEMERAYEALCHVAHEFDLARDRFNSDRIQYDNYKAGKKQEAGK